MEELYKELLPLFPSKFHPYKLILDGKGCHFVTLHWGYYVATFVLITAVLYLFLYWESAYKYHNPFTSPPVRPVSRWTNILMLSLCALAGLILTGIPFALYSNDTTKISLDAGKQAIVLHGVFASEKIPFNKINEVAYHFITVSRKSGRTNTVSYQETIQIKTNASNSPLIIYYIRQNKEGAEAEAGKVSKILNQYFEKVNKKI